ncbi:MAG: isoprenyl transferase [Bacillota bacterium]
MFDFLRKSKNKEQPSPTSIQFKNGLPNHIAIIMDGNGRWAEKRGLPRTFGHRQGVEALRDIVKACVELEVKILTVYAFSTENWKRPKQEIDVLMNLLIEYMQSEIKELNKQGVKINPIGDIASLPPTVVNEIEKAVLMTKNNDKLTFNLALNYGGRAEMVRAFKNIAGLLQSGELRKEDISEFLLEKHLFTSGQPDPDLLIRPSGEYRLSNFLLWQTAYSEFWVTDVLWPDFKKKDLVEAIQDYQIRNRRFGGLDI